MVDMSGTLPHTSVNKWKWQKDENKSSIVVVAMPKIHVQV